MLIGGGGGATTTTSSTTTTMTISLRTHARGLVDGTGYGTAEEPVEVEGRGEPEIPARSIAEPLQEQRGISSPQM